MKHFSTHSIHEKRGITLLLVVVILSTLLSISIGIFNVVYGEIRISGEIADSFVALYAADRGMEKALYRDRILSDASGESTLTSEVNGCYVVVIDKTPDCGGSGVNTCVTSTGQYQCGVEPPRVVKRRFVATY